MVTLPEPKSGTKRPKLTTPIYGAFVKVLSTKSFAISEVLAWYGDGVQLGWSLGGVIGLGLIFPKKLSSQQSWRNVNLRLS